MRIFKTLALLCGAVVAIAGCGSSSSKKAGSSSGGAGNIPAANQAAAQDMVPWKQKNTKLPTSAPPAAKGKFMVAVSCGIQIEGCRAISQGHVQAAQALGWKTQLVDGKGTAQGWASGLQAAIQLHPDVIALGAVDPRAVGDLIKKANTQGIKVVATTAALDTTGPGSRPDGLAFSNGTEGISKPLGKDAADYVLSKSGTKANALVMDFPEFQAAAFRRSGFVNEYKRLCPSCKMRVITTKIAEWGTTLPGRLQGILQQNPDINWIFSPSDEAAVDSANAIKAAGLTGKVRAVGGNGEKQSFERVASDPGYAAVTATSYFFAAWEAMDQANRLVQGKPLAPIVVQPNRLMDKSNVSVVPAGQYWSTDFDFEKAYKTLWGK